MIVLKKDIKLLRLMGGKIPFLEWLDSLRNERVRQVIQARIDRVALGNLGDFRTVGSSVVELRVHFGPGYRIYLGLEGDRVVILICGGDKSRQHEDIKKAQQYWKEYKKGKGHEHR